MEPLSRDEQLALAIERYRAGASIYDIGRELGLAPQTISKWLVKAGIPRRSKSEGTQLAFEKSGRGRETRQRRFEYRIAQEHLEAQRAVAVARYRNGESATAIGRDLGRPTVTISNWLKASGVEMRTQSEACRKHALNEHVFDTIDSEPKAYWLGFFAADGSVSDQGEIRVNLKLNDQDHLEQLRAFFETSIPVRTARNVGGYSSAEHYCYLSIRSLRLKDSLSQLGIHPRKTQSLEWPRSIPEPLIQHFVRGYFDGDGSWSAHQWRVVGTLTFLQEIEAAVFRQLGLSNAKTYPHHTTPGIGYLVYCERSASLAVGIWMYQSASVFLQRKFASFKSAHPTQDSV